MSITLGVYDLFAYMVPGIFYLYIANEYLKQSGLNHIEMQNLDNVAVLVLTLITAYVLGQSLDFIANQWRRWGQASETTKVSIEKLKKNHPKCEIKFLPQDWPLLLSLIRRFHPEVATTADRSKAISIMFQNISLGLLFYMLFQLISFFTSGYSVDHSLSAVLALAAALLSRRRSQLYNR